MTSGQAAYLVIVTFFALGMAYLLLEGYGVKQAIGKALEAVRDWGLVALLVVAVVVGLGIAGGNDVKTEQQQTNGSK